MRQAGTERQKYVQILLYGDVVILFLWEQTIKGK